LVDPDNRRPVDYALRRATLDAFATHGDPEALCAELLAAWPDGRIKLYVTWRLLQLRRARTATFASGGYRPLRVDAPGPDGVVAFARDDVIVLAPRLVRARLRPGSLTLGDAAGRVIAGMPGERFRNVLDGRVLTADDHGGVGLAAAFARLPLAVLARVGGGAAGT
jgi:(1->4)-alpha-D-glucan 1-alpha-D-glucosylmutase